MNTKYTIAHTCDAVLAEDTSRTTCFLVAVPARPAAVARDVFGTAMPMPCEAESEADGATVVVAMVPVGLGCEDGGVDAGDPDTCTCVKKY